MRTHVTILAWIHLVWNGLHLLFGALLLLGFLGISGLGLAATGPAGLPIFGLFGAIGGFIAIAFSIFSIPGFLVGLGLLNLAPWARIGAIIISILQLFYFPIGTLLGIYGLVVMFNPETVALFDRYGGSPL